MRQRRGEYPGEFRQQMVELVKAGRKKLDLGQREAAEIFGGGVNAFSRSENGKTKLPLALFKLLDRHPDLLNEVRSA